MDEFVSIDVHSWFLISTAGFTFKGWVRPLETEPQERKPKGVFRARWTGDQNLRAKVFTQAPITFPLSLVKELVGGALMGKVGVFVMVILEVNRLVTKHRGLNV